MKNWSEMTPGAFDSSPPALPLSLPAEPELAGVLPLDTEPEPARPAWSAHSLPMLIGIARDLLAKPSPVETGRGEAFFRIGELRAMLASLTEAAADAAGIER